MLARDLLNRVKREQESKMAAIEESLGKGGASDWDHYKSLVGELKGRRAVLTDLEELVTKLEREDDDATE